MRTIEVDATVTADGTLIVQVSPDIRPGSYHVVVVIETTGMDVSAPLTRSPAGAARPRRNLGGG